MAARLIRVDCSSSCVATCRCGWRSDAVPTPADAHHLADAHRRAEHRKALIDAARQRRHRAGAAP